MTESVEWERLADHEEAPGDRAELTRRPLCDRIGYVADQLEASITGLRGLVGVSRTRVVLAASVVTLREVADLVLDQGVELGEVREQLQSATVLAERDAARRELAEVRERIGAPTPAGYEYRANGPLIHKITEDDVSRYPDEWVGDYLPERRPLYAGAWERLDGGEWKAVDGG